MLSYKNKTNAAPPLWHNRNYLLLQGGQIVSFIGDQQQFIAFSLLILAITGSAVQAGIALSLGTIAVLVVSPLAGVFVDRWDRKKIMLTCDAGRALLILSIPLAFWFHVLSMPHIYVVVALAGVLGAIFDVAEVAALPNVVTQEQLPAALSQSQMAYSGARTFGAMLGGTLYNLNSFLPFLVNAISFGASVFSLRFIRGNFQSEQQERPNLPLHQTIAEGFTWLWSQPLLRFLTIVNGADSLRYGAGYLVIVVLAQELHTSPGGIGAIFTAAAVGALAGNFASNWARQRFSFGTIAISMLWLEALMFPLYAVAPNAIFIGVIAAAEELVAPIYMVALNAYRLTVTPDSMRGRMSSVVQLLTRGMQSVGAIVGGLLIQEVGAKWSAVLLGGWLVLLAIATTLNRRVRHASFPVPLSDL